MSETNKRAAIYITWTDDIQHKLDAIAAFIIGLGSKHPLFPQPLMPSHASRRGEGEYDAGELSECCARLLATRISEGAVSDAELSALLGQVIATNKTSKSAAKLIKGRPRDFQVDDLIAIAERLDGLAVTENRGKKGGVNLKIPMDVAILYAFAEIQKDS